MKFKFTIEGLDCPNCAAKLAAMIEKLEGIESCKINFLSEKLTAESTLDEQTLLGLLNKTAVAFDKNVKIG